MRVFLLLIMMTSPLAAQEMPACNAARLGAVACLSNRLCECRFERGGSLTGAPTGHRWNCGILRPSCGEMPGNGPATEQPVPSIIVPVEPMGRPRWN